MKDYRVASRRVVLVVLMIVAGSFILVVRKLDSDWIRANWRELWSGDNVAGIYHDTVETVAPLRIGPSQELFAGWTSVVPRLDGVLSVGEWDHAAVVEIDGTDRIRPGVATGAKGYVQDRPTSGTIPHASNHAVLYVMNDATAIYAAVDVTDDYLDFGEGDLAQHDSVELFVRSDGREGSRSGDGPEYFLLVRGDGLKSVGGLPDVRFAMRVKPDDSGYVLELRWRYEPVEAIGFDVGVNDRDDPGLERNQYYWNGTQTRLLRESRQLGKLILAVSASR